MSSFLIPIQPQRNPSAFSTLRSFTGMAFTTGVLAPLPPKSRVKFSGMGRSGSGGTAVRFLGGGNMVSTQSHGCLKMGFFLSHVGVMFKFVPLVAGDFSRPNEVKHGSNPCNCKIQYIWKFTTRRLNMMGIQIRNLMFQRFFFRLPVRWDSNGHVSDEYVANIANLGWCWITLPKTNIAPENRPSQKETSLPTIHFQWLC